MGSVQERGSPSGDVEVFENVVRELWCEFRDNPFNFGNEQSVLPELFHRLRENLNEPWVDVVFETDYGKDSRKVREARNIESPGEVSRVRSELAFVDDGEAWRPSDSGVSFMFDLGVFKRDSPLVMQSKRTGPSNYWDTSNDLSILLELKHSKNGTISGMGFIKNIASDLWALADYPGRVEHRAFLLVDWWPEDYRGNRRFPQFKDAITTEIDSLPQPVTVTYLPRDGEQEVFILN